MLLVGVLKRKKENCKWGGRRGGGRWGGEKLGECQPTDKRTPT